MTNDRPNNNTQEQAAKPRPPTTPAAKRTAELQQRAAKAMETLARQLEQGKSEELLNYLRVMSRFHSYSFGNIMLIFGQRPDATHVAGFQTWRTLGRTVKKGEKGIAILAPMRFRPSDEDTDQEATPARPAALRFRVVHVFDVEQTEGEPLPEPQRVAGEPGPCLPALEHAVRAAGITLSDSNALGGADGVSRGGAIELREGLLPAERFSVLAHEYAHELMHKCEPRPSRQIKELEAEAVAFVVCGHIGLEARRSSADYILLYQGAPAMLAASMNRIQVTACRIIEEIEATVAAHGRPPAQAAQRAGRQR